MLYIVHMDNGHGEWGWVYVVPQKQEALDFAKDYAEGEKKVVFLSAKSKRTYTAFKATKTVVVQESSNYYNGA